MKVSLLALLLLGLFLSGPVRALSFHDFTRMNDDDDATYVAALVEGAAKYMRAHGQPDQATRLIALFKDSSKAGGVNQLVMNSKMLNNQNNRNATNPNNRAQVYGVEDAMERTLKDNGFDVPVTHLRTINQDFRPVGPPRGRAPGDA